MSKTSKFLHEHFLPSRSKLAKTSKGGPLGMGKWGFMAPELAQFAYAAFTSLLLLVTWTSHQDASSLLWQRFTILSGTLALWVVSQLWRCRIMIFLRMAYLLATLSLWYPDTYELNKHFGCLDHVFASIEQGLFGFQPALLFSQQFPSAVVSELMYMGYYAYFLFFVVMVFMMYFLDFKQLERVSYIIFGGFFTCYCIFDILPVVGPQYYYQAVGIEEIARGVFPDLEHHFADHTEAITMPGWGNGLFYHLCNMNHAVGERPTAAFPSSHVAIATLVMAIAIRMRLWKYLLCIAVPYLFLCMSTVYIMAHYAIDSFAGFLFGILLFFVFGGMKLRRVA